MRGAGGPSRTGFSLVELLIAVSILGVGLLMVAGAFPVGLSYHSRSVDQTIAGLLARTAVNRLTVPITSDGRGDFGSKPTRYRDCAGQLGVVECFQSPDPAADVQVLYLFEGGASPTHAGGVLADAGLLGDDINAWLPPAERVYEADARYSFQVFYRLLADPGGRGMQGSKTYEVYVVVQRSDTAARDASYDPSPLLSITALDAAGRRIQLSDPSAAQAGAVLVDCRTGSWFEVIDASASGTVLNRAPASDMAGHKVRVVNHAVAVFAAVVSKQLFQ